MARFVLVIALFLTLPALSGCLNDAPEDVEAASVAASATEAGAVAGSAPAAAKSPYQVQAGDADGDAAVTVYPVVIETNAAKAQYTDTFTGEYAPQECAPTGGGLPLGGLGLASGGKFFDVADAFAQNDVFSFDVSLAWTNTDQSWADLHLWQQFDGVGNYWNEPTGGERGEVLLNFSGQGFIVNEDFFAGLGVDCWYGSVTQPIPFTITLTVTFAEGAVPAQVPVLLTVPAGATKLFVSGVPLDETQPVLSHYRVFAPNDELVCECALNSDEAADVLDLPEAGEYVVLVDHTANGFVGFALDAPAEELLLPLATTFATYPLVATEGGPVDETVNIDVPSTPLAMWAWVFAPGEINGPPNAGAGHNVKISVANGRGEVLRTSMVGYATFHAAIPDVLLTNDWYAVPLDGDWEFFVDHHAYDLGPHTVHVTAEQMRGEARLFALHYERPPA